MCAAAKNCKKTIKTPYIKFSRSLKVIGVDTTKKLVTSLCYHKHDDVCAICNRFYARRSNSGKITILQEYTYLTPPCAGLLNLLVLELFYSLPSK